VNGDERARHRVEVAREGLAGYEDWLHSDDPARPIDPQALAKLASAARWLIETLTEDTT
jgi:hypothetical protein